MGPRKEHLQRFGCDGKSVLRTHAHAVAVAKRMRKHRGERIVEYRCSVCGWWHVGTAPERAVRDRRTELTKVIPKAPAAVLEDELAATAPDEKEM